MSPLGTLETIHIEDRRAEADFDFEYELNVARYGIHPVCRDCPAERYHCRRSPNGPTLKITCYARARDEAAHP
jgi:hypothetical protein